MIIEAKNVSLFTATKEAIIENASFSVPDGKKAIFTGPSGTGKSSLLKTILGGFPHWTGEIKVNNIPLSPDTLQQIRSQIAYIGQEPKLPFGTVEEYIRTLLSYKINRHLSYNKEKSIAYLKKVRLPEETLSKSTTILSGGERQRVAIIGALLLERPIIFADEVTSALDSESQRSVINLLFQNNTTLLSVSHDPRWQKECNQLFLIENKAVKEA